MDVTEVILNDHHEQRRLFAALEEIGADHADALSSVWDRLLVLLEVHAKAEELYFYPRLLKLQQDRLAEESPEAETVDAIHDHNEIRDAVSGVKGLAVGSVPWFKAVAHVNEVNSDHMAEEERQGLTDFRRHVDRETRHAIAVDFHAFEAQHPTGIAAHDEDPQHYVDDNE